MSDDFIVLWYPLLLITDSQSSLAYCGKRIKGVALLKTIFVKHIQVNMIFKIDHISYRCKS